MKPSPITLFCVTALATALLSCKKSEAPKAEAPAAPQAQSAPAPAGDTMLTGTVLETMDATNYTYVRVKTTKGEIWAAATQFKVAIGDKVTVPVDMPMQNFESPTLKRTFPVIYFTSRIFKEGEAPATAAHP